MPFYFYIYNFYNFLYIYNFVHPELVLLLRRARYLFLSFFLFFVFQRNDIFRIYEDITPRLSEKFVRTCSLPLPLNRKYLTHRNARVDL